MERPRSCTGLPEMQWYTPPFAARPGNLRSRSLISSALIARVSFSRFVAISVRRVVLCKSPRGREIDCFCFSAPSLLSLASDRLLLGLFLQSMQPSVKLSRNASEIASKVSEESEVRVNSSNDFSRALLSQQIFQITPCIAESFVACAEIRSQLLGPCSPCV